MTHTFTQLKSRIILLRENINTRMGGLQHKKRISEEDKYVLNVSLERLKKLQDELRNWGVGHTIVVMDIEVWEIFPYQTNSLSERKHYTIYYDNVSMDEAKELIEVHFPKAIILNAHTIQTGTKITKKKII